MEKKFDLRKIILEFPDQFRKALEISLSLKEKIALTKFEKIIICGMGGSSFPGDLLFLFNWQIPIHIHRNYSLPYFADKKSLIICISDSGDTEETISSYQEALKKKLSTVSISSGGRLKELSSKNRTPLFQIPNSSLPPRYATGYIFTFLVKIISLLKTSQNDKKIAQKILKTLKTIDKKLKKKIPLLEEQAKKISRKIKNKIPLIYASAEDKMLARIWKIKINENAKEAAFWNFFPELDHNEMSSFESKFLKNFIFFFLKDKNQNPRILKRMNLTKRIIKEKNGRVVEIEFKKTDQIERIFLFLLLGDFLSYHLALLYKKNPWPTELQERFKKMLL